VRAEAVGKLGSTKVSYVSACCPQHLSNQPQDMHEVLLKPAARLQLCKRTQTGGYLASVVCCVCCAAGKRIKCSRLDGPGIMLLGDAAHAVTPVSVRQHLMEGCLCQPAAFALRVLWHSSHRAGFAPLATPVEG